MPSQSLAHLMAAMQELSACTDADTLLAEPLLKVRDICSGQAAAVWLLAEMNRLRLQHATDGVYEVAQHLQRMSLPPQAEHTLEQQLRALGYRAVLVARLQVNDQLLGLVAVWSRARRSFRRLEADMFRLLVDHAAVVLAYLRARRAVEAVGAWEPVSVADNDVILGERTRLIQALISAITHDLNNTLTAISMRMELLLSRVVDQAARQHGGLILRSTLEAGQLIHHIREFVGARNSASETIVDVNQLVEASIQIARSAAFRDILQMRFPVELAVELNPVSPLVGRPLDLTIALLGLLRYAMDLAHPRPEVRISTGTAGESGRSEVFISVSTAGRSIPLAEHLGGIELLFSVRQSPQREAPLQLVGETVRRHGGRILVHQSADGATTVTMAFPLEREAAPERPEAR
jgi:signal transduction histidine kinase